MCVGNLFFTALPDLGYNVYTVRAFANSTCLCAQHRLELQKTSKELNVLCTWLSGFPSPNAPRSHHSLSHQAANQSKGRKLSWPADSPRALMAIYGKNHCQSPVRPTSRLLWTYQWTAAAAEASQGNVQRTGCLLISRGGGLGGEGGSRHQPGHTLSHNHSL